MKTKYISIGLSLLVASIIMGCSSGGGVSTSLKYAGSVTPGDFLHFSRTGNTISYEVEGDVFGHVTGELNVTDMTGDGYVFKGTVNGEESYFFTVDNIGMAAIPIDGETFLGVGLREAKNGLTSNDIVGSYAYGEVEFNPTTHNPVDADGCEIEVEANGTADINCISGSHENGGWKIAEDSSHILYKANTRADDITEDNADARVIVRPPEDGGTKGFLVDIAGGKGFGIGLERKTMTQDSVKGDYLAINYLDRKLLDVVVVPDSEDPDKLSYTTSSARLSGQSLAESSESGGGTIVINHDCNGTARQGIACISANNGKEYVGSLDNQEGYFALIGNENVIVGVHKP